jgi:hypothetical protein
VKSAYQRGREAAIADLESFLADATDRALRVSRETNDGKLASERMGAFDRGVLVGAAAAYQALLEVVRMGSIPRLEGSIEPAEPSV